MDASQHNRPKNMVEISSFHLKQVPGIRRPRLDFKVYTLTPRSPLRWKFSKAWCGEYLLGSSVCRLEFSCGWIVDGRNRMTGYNVSICFLTKQAAAKLPDDEHPAKKKALGHLSVQQRKNTSWRGPARTPNR